LCDNVRTPEEILSTPIIVNLQHTVTYKSRFRYLVTQ